MRYFIEHIMCTLSTMHPKNISYKKESTKEPNKAIWQLTFLPRFDGLGSGRIGSWSKDRGVSEWNFGYFILFIDDRSERRSLLMIAMIWVADFVETCYI